MVTVEEPAFTFTGRPLVAMVSFAIFASAVSDKSDRDSASIYIFMQEHSLRKMSSLPLARSSGHESGPFLERVRAPLAPLSSSGNRKYLGNERFCLCQPEPIRSSLARFLAPGGLCLGSISHY